jgi:rhodanese-related sulfurtransferase
MERSAEPAPFKTLTPEEVAAKLAAGEEVFVVDVREPRDYHAGHIADALLLPADTFADRYARELDPDDEVILVCEKGLTSEAAARFLLSQGFSNVATMAGGMRAWAGPRESRG